jgi:hypothetical protein
MMTISDGPPAHLFTGKLGEEIMVISVPMLRAAQRLDAASEIETADGTVVGRVGDFVVTQSNGERYPILASVFYGTYQIVGRVGSRFVGRRLLHTRRAWPIQSAHAEFNYGEGRGKVAAPRGGWIYRSDENDYGLINAEAKSIAHIEVGTTRSLRQTNWTRWFQWTVRLTSLLPPVMTMVALVAYTAALREHQVLSQLLLAIEGICVALGAATVWWVRKDRWVLKAAVSAGTNIARDFQSAVELLGQNRSDLFPDMALWRAAQSDQHGPDFFSPQGLRSLKEQVFTTYDCVREEIEGHHSEEKRTMFFSWIAVLVVLGCTACAWWTHAHFFELLAIWLPSAVGAMHASVWRRQIVNRIGAGREFLSELAFVRSQLMSLVPNDRLETKDVHQAETLRATLRVLCRAVGEHTQRKLQFAIAEDPNVAV